MLKKSTSRQNETIDRISNKDTNSNNRFDKDIALEQKKIDDAYARIEVLDKDVEASHQTIKDGAAQTE